MCRFRVWVFLCAWHPLFTPCLLRSWNVLSLHIPISHTHTHTHAFTFTHSLDTTGLSSNIITKSWWCCGLHACHTVTAEQSREQVRQRERVGANFGCMACGVRITIFSAALLQHSTLFVQLRSTAEREGNREREREREQRKRRARAPEEKREEVDGDAGNRCEIVGENTVGMKSGGGEQSTFCIQGQDNSRVHWVKCFAELTWRRGANTHTVT